MDWFYDLHFWLVAVTVILFWGCVLLFILYRLERKQKNHYRIMASHAQRHNKEMGNIAEEALKVSREQCKQAISVLDRILTIREKEEFGLKNTQGTLQREE